MGEQRLLRTAALFVVFGVTLGGQTRDAVAPPQENLDRQEESPSRTAKESIGNAANAAKEAVGLESSLTGCLTMGDEADPYLLSGSDAGKRVTIVGLGSLVEHLNHTVRLKGGWESAGRVFHATELEHIASSCDAASAADAHPAEEHYAPSAEGRGAGGPGGPETEALTADQQGKSAADRRTTRAIRRTVVADESLSTYAHNVKIITRDGVVTLRGPVRSERERSAIEEMARSVAGAGKVNNELTVEPRGAGERQRREK